MVKKVTIYSTPWCVYCKMAKKHFYEAIGFELHKIQGGWSINYYYFAKLENDLNLNIGLSEPDKIIKENRFAGALVFSVDDVVEVIKKLKSINAPILAPHPLLHGACDRATVQDPDGRQIRLRKK